MEVISKKNVQFKIYNYTWEDFKKPQLFNWKIDIHCTVDFLGSTIFDFAAITKNLNFSPTELNLKYLMKLKPILRRE